VIVTLGGDGVLVVGGDQDQIVPSRPVTVRDTTGAGDTFNGVLAARLAAGDDLEAAAALANHAAGISVGSVGARPGMPNFAVLAQSGRPAGR
jgi:ribokinase